MNPNPEEQNEIDKETEKQIYENDTGLNFEFLSDSESSNSDEDDTILDSNYQSSNVPTETTQNKKEKPGTMTYQNTILQKDKNFLNTIVNNKAKNSMPLMYNQRMNIMNYPQMNTQNINPQMQQTQSFQIPIQRINMNRNLTQIPMQPVCPIYIGRAPQINYYNTQKLQLSSNLYQRTLNPQNIQQNMNMGMMDQINQNNIMNQMNQLAILNQMCKKTKKKKQRHSMVDIKPNIMNNAQLNKNRQSIILNRNINRCQNQNYLGQYPPYGQNQFMNNTNGIQFEQKNQQIGQSIHPNIQKMPIKIQPNIPQNIPQNMTQIPGQINNLPNQINNIPTQMPTQIPNMSSPIPRQRGSVNIIPSPVLNQMNNMSSPIPRQRGSVINTPIPSQLPTMSNSSLPQFQSIISPNTFTHLPPKTESEESSSKEDNDFYATLESALINKNKIDDEILSKYEGQFIKVIKDKRTSKLIQFYLSNSSKEIINKIFNLINGNIPELLEIQFSNYFLQKFYGFLNQKERLIFLQKIKHCFIHLCTAKASTYAMQNIIEKVSSNEEKKIVVEIIKDDVLHLSLNLYGTHIVEKIIIGFEYNILGDKFFIVFVDNFLLLTNNPNGLCVIKKFLSLSFKYLPKESYDKLKDEINKNLIILTENPYGNYAIQIIFKSWEITDCEIFFKNFIGKFSALSCGKFSSNVVERCLERSSKFLEKFIHEILENNYSGLIILLKNSFGNFVLQTAVKLFHNENFNKIIEETITNEIKDKKILSKWKVFFEKGEEDPK
ncbi:MAG: hypothetical protein MJ252_21575 [archaeon]|nr:hypothetical protein [archaeon]